MNDELIAMLAVAGGVVAYIACAAWVTYSAGRHSRHDAKNALIFFLLGPFAALMRISVRLDRALDDFGAHALDPADAVLARVAALETAGEWEQAIALYQGIAERWPERAVYAENCIAAIREKQAASGA